MADEKKFVMTEGARDHVVTYLRCIDDLRRDLEKQGPGYLMLVTELHRCANGIWDVLTNHMKPLEDT